MWFARTCATRTDLRLLAMARQHLGALSTTNILGCVRRSVRIAQQPRSTQRAPTLQRFLAHGKNGWQWQGCRSQKPHRRRTSSMFWILGATRPTQLRHVRLHYNRQQRMWCKAMSHWQVAALRCSQMWIRWQKESWQQPSHMKAQWCMTIEFALIRFFVRVADGLSSCESRCSWN